MANAYRTGTSFVPYIAAYCIVMRQDAVDNFFFLL
jgi:hypothetical protein